jgi:hypothetical protein
VSRGTSTTTYNPHLLSREALVASFIARAALLDELVDDLRRGGHQHHLLIGARGSGKTTLLLRLAVAIEEDKKLARSALPLRFPEEQYNVARPSDFWLNCLDALTDALEARGDQAGKRRLESSIASIEALPEAERSAAVLEALTGWAKRAGRILVLLVDNLGMILERLRGSQWDLREALSQDNRIVLIGATSSFLEESTAYESPLYDFFHVHELGQLPEDEARRVVAQLAKLSGSVQVENVLETDLGRFKALYVLTGGMPRMLALLTSVLATESGPGENDLERMLDQLTPYYKARFDELAPQSQIVVDAVALHWHPITAAECAEKTRLDVNLVSSQLNRLVKLGLLIKVALPGASRLAFQLAERFFNIWYLMRASRRARQKLVWFVEFLRIFYSEEDLLRRAQALLDREPAANSPSHMLALASAVQDPSLRLRLEARVISTLVDQMQPHAIRELLDVEGDDAHLAPVLDRVRTLKDLRAQAEVHPKLKKAAVAIIESPVVPLQSKVLLINHLARTGKKPPNFKDRQGDQPYVLAIFGSSLASAIARGEAPGPFDVRTPEELALMMKLATQPALAAAFTFVSLETSKDPAAENIYHQIEATSYFSEAMLWVATSLVNGGKWQRGRTLAIEALRRGEPSLRDLIPLVFSFFQACVQKSLISEATELLAELDLIERWVPLYEALKAIGEGPSRLGRLAPELRTVVESLREALQKPAKTLIAPVRSRTPRKQRLRRKQQR